MPAYIETFAWNLQDLEVPWHGQGNAVERYDTYRDFMCEAGLDWSAVPVPLYFDMNGVRPGLGIAGQLPTPRMQDVGNHRALVRSTDGAVLGIHSKGYVPLQNVEAFQFTEDLVADGDIRYVSAGALDGGKRVFVVAKIEGDPLQIVPGDVAEKYFLLANSHDGSMAVTCKFTGVLVVCQNTLNMALRDGTKGVKVKHTRNMHHRLVEGKKLLGLADEKFARFQRLAQDMARIPMPKATFNDFALQLVAPGKLEADLSNAQDIAYENLQYLFESGPGQNIDGRRGTVWGAHNAVTAWTTHLRETRHEEIDGNRVRYVLLGGGEAMNAKAEKLLVDQYQLAA